MTPGKQSRRTPAQAAILKLLGTRLNNDAKASLIPCAEQALLRRAIDTHRESLIRALLPNLGECTRGGWTVGLTGSHSGHSSLLYIDADFRRWRTAQGPDAAAETGGTDALSLLVFMRPCLGRGENLIRILGLCSLDVLGAAT